MKLSCLQNKFNYGLSVVGRAASIRSTLPITANVLLSTDNSRLKLSATNLEMAISCWVGAKVEEQGEITVNSRLLTEFIGSLPNEQVDINLGARSKTIKLQCARFEARISGMDAAEFPPLPTLEKGVETAVDTNAFCQAINQVVFAADSGG